MTKEEFKKRWDSNENGGGITYDEIAECAVGWGITERPKIQPIRLITAAVCRAANVEDMPRPSNSED